MIHAIGAFLWRAVNGYPAEGICVGAVLFIALRRGVTWARRRFPAFDRSLREAGVR